MIGYPTGTFAVNGVDFLLEPTEHKWLPRTMLGRDGAGHPIYSGVREYEMRFQLASLTDYWQLQQWFNTMSNIILGFIIACSSLCRIYKWHIYNKNKIISFINMSLNYYVTFAITILVAIGLIAIPSYLISQDTNTTSCKTTPIVFICLGVSLFIGTIVVFVLTRGCT